MLPRVIIHNAVSADGRIDCFIPDTGLFYELASVFKEDASLTGADTLLAAPVPEDAGGGEPADPEAKKSLPLLAVTDTRGRIRNWPFWRAQPYWRDVVVLCSRATPREYLSSLEEQRVDHIVAGEDKADLALALGELNARFGVSTVRADSGGTLNGALLRAGLAREVSLLIHPALVGGLSPRSLFRAPDISSPDDVIPLKLVFADTLRDGIVWLRYEVLKQQSGNP